MGQNKRRVATAVTALLLAGVIGGCGESDIGAVEPGGASSTPATSSPSGGYDAKGFPLDENGNASSNPDDYKETVCNQPWAKDAPDYDQECR